MSNCDIKGIRKQSGFCLELMQRLDKEIKVSEDSHWNGMENHIRKQDDIKRIRRELMMLSQMLDPWRKEDE